MFWDHQHIFFHNMPTKTSSGNIRIHRYFRACKPFHEVVDNCVCLSLLLIMSLARSSMLCDAVLCNLCLLACMCVWILGMDCGNRAGKTEMRHPFFEARLPPSFFALVCSQFAAFSLQYAFSLGSLGWDGWARFIEIQMDMKMIRCHHFGKSGRRWGSQLLIASVSLYMHQ